MKQRDLLFAGLLLLGAPAFAQDEPTRTPQDAKVIFFQDFEADWEEWSTKEIDRIEVLEYYNHPGMHNGTDMTPWTQRDQWERGLFRTDSLIILQNGIKPTDNLDEIADQNFGGDVYGTTDELKADNDRKDAMKTFGQSDEGGDYVLKYVSDTCNLASSPWGTYKGGYTANYRRNLFVRGLDIEENTSYRLTFFVKARNNRAFEVTDSYNNTPRMSAGVFRGYYQSEKPFSMGVLSDPDHNKFNTQFEYTKNDFNGEWEKVTYMTYYLNDSVANDFVFVDGYWWAEEPNPGWKWAADAPENPTGDSLYYIVQPDKFFVRIGFLSDFTTFYLDNLSLTKSTIGGAEYYDDKLRIDFGYKTNMADIVAKAKAKTNIGAAEIKYDDAAQWLKDSLKYEDRFEVWGLKGSEWEPVYIRSAEYHDDGYMYMFTDYEPNPITGDLEPLQFNDYDSVLVTFHNPIDLEELTLKYSGTGRDLANAFPNALDTNWINNGKIVPDFYNEIATPNPYIFKGVHSLADLPPVLQNAEIPDGSFFLPTQESFSFKFSRPIWCENYQPGQDLSNTDKAVAYVNGVAWRVEKSSENDSVIIVSCPDESWKTMSGDYVINLIQLKGLGTEYGANVELHYNFGAPTRNISIDLPQIDLSFTMTGAHPSIPRGVYTWSANAKTIGDGSVNNTGNLNKMYTHNEGAIKKGYEVRPHGGGNGGHVYLGADTLAGDPDYTITLGKGGYTFKFKGTGWSWNGGAIQPVTVYVFKNVKDPTSVSSNDKMQIGVYNPSVASDDGNLQDINFAIPASAVDEVSYSFNIEEDGDYIIEFNNKAGAWSQGSFVGDFELYEGIISSHVAIVTDLNNAVANAKTRRDLAEEDLDNYGGSIYTALNGVIDYYDIDGEFDSKLEKTVAAWEAAIKAVKDATNSMALRMDTVNTFTKKVDDVMNKLAQSIEFEDLVAYSDLDGLYKDAGEYPVTTKTGEELYAFNKQMDDAIKALDDRIALNNAYSAALSAAESLVEAIDAKTQYAQYDDLENCYNSYELGFDEIEATDAELKDATAAIIAATNAYKRIVQGAKVLPTRVKALSALAKSLDPSKSDTKIAWNGALDERVDAEDFDNDELAEIYKTAIKYAIYDAAAANLNDAAIDSIDITPFIKNYHLYTTATLGATNSNETVDDSKEVNVYSIQTGWGNPPQFTDYAIATRGQEYETTFPGWKFKSYQGQNYIGKEKVDWNSPDHDLVFDAYLASDWSSKVEMSQEITDLPVGQYTLGVAMSHNEDAGTDTKFIATTNGASYQVSPLNKVDAAPVNVNTFIDSVQIVANDTLTLKVEIPNHNSWVRVDNFYMAFRPVEGVNYDDLATELESKLDELMTVVDLSKAVKEGVEYYTVGGMKLDAPKAGQILIRKTTQSNGKVVMDKVIIK